MAFVAAIAADPNDRIVKLVYADWLDELGGPTRRSSILRQLAAAPHMPQAYTTAWAQWWVWKDADAAGFVSSGFCYLPGPVYAVAKCDRKFFMMKYDEKSVEVLGYESEGSAIGCFHAAVLTYLESPR